MSLTNKDRMGTLQIKWIDVCLDADVHDGVCPIPAAGAARFSVKVLALALGYGENAGRGDALAMAHRILGCVSEGLSWADEPWSMVEAKGDCAVATLGPGTINQASWDVLSRKMEKVCAEYGNPGARFEIGQGLESARASWFSSAGAHAKGKSVN